MASTSALHAKDNAARPRRSIRGETERNRNNINTFAMRKPIADAEIESEKRMLGSAF
jgi:hypothetical protein